MELTREQYTYIVKILEQRGRRVGSD